MSHPSERPSQGPPSDQRRYVRYQIWFPVTIEVPSGQVWGICRDVSPKGLMMSSATPLAVGETVAVVFRVAPEDTDLRAKGKIVRAWKNDDELLLAFPFRMAIEFDETVTEIQERCAKHSS